MGVLIFTQKQLQPVTPLEISQFFNIAKPSVSAMVKSLLKQGYLIKESSVEDKRSYTLSITEKGATLVSSTFEEYLKNMTLIKEKMGASMFDQFIALIKLSNDILEGEK
jgi:DNA-binding MarR family transcriptional regulator